MKMIFFLMLPSEIKLFIAIRNHKQTQWRVLELENANKTIGYATGGLKVNDSTADLYAE
jgi:hypothetical protein